MVCRNISGGGLTIWLCGVKDERQDCVSCGSRATAACSFELKGDKAGENCSRPLCKRCVVIVDGKPLCGVHHRLMSRKGIDG